MKKAIIGFLLFLSVSLCFAKGILDDYIEVGIGYHNMIHTATRNIIITNPSTYQNERITGDVVNEISSIAINVAYIKYLSENFGLGCYVNTLIPQEDKITVPWKTPYLLDSSLDRTLVKAWDILIGPIIKIYNSEKIIVASSAGIHGYIVTNIIYNGEEDVYSFQLGIGANITGEYHFNPKLYAYARFNIAYDFRSWETGKHEMVEGNNGLDGGSISAWNISPTIGIGYRFGLGIAELYEYLKPKQPKDEQQNGL